MPDERRRFLFRPSFAVKMAVLLVIFLAVPAILYTQFRAADAEKNRLLLANVQNQGRLTAAAVRPLLDRFGPDTAKALNERVAALGQQGGLSLKVLFRPAARSGGQGFYFVAAWPAVPTKTLEAEQAELMRTGILDKVRGTCEGNLPLALRFTPPDGREELLASLTPLDVPSGCWVVITAYRSDAYLQSSLGRPYWRSPEVQVAAAIYLVMALAVVWLFAGAWRNLRRFATLAGRIGRRGGSRASFRQLNRMPELDGVAEAIDRMVGALHSSAAVIRQTAEENAHALKAPVAVISQAVEPIKRVLGEGDAGARRAVALIEQSVERLDALVSAARRLDQATAEAIDPGREPVDLSALLDSLLDGCAEAWAEGGPAIVRDLAPDLTVLATPDMLETVFENLLENAQGFSPAGGCVRVRAVRQGGTAEVAVEDDGPGVDPARLERIFERYVSERPAEGPGSAAPGGAHFGIGLWIVKRNVEALGGSVSAAIRPEGGLRVTVHLPLAAG